MGLAIKSCKEKRKNLGLKNPKVDLDFTEADKIFLRHHETLISMRQRSGLPKVLVGPDWYTHNFKTKSETKLKS